MKFYKIPVFWEVTTFHRVEVYLHLAAYKAKLFLYRSEQALRVPGV